MKTKTLYVRVSPEIAEKISDIAHAKKLNNPQAINEIFNEYFTNNDLKSFIKNELEQTKKDINFWTLRTIKAAMPETEN